MDNGRACNREFRTIFLLQQGRGQKDHSYLKNSSRKAPENQLAFFVDYSQRNSRLGSGYILSTYSDEYGYDAYLLGPLRK